MLSVCCVCVMKECCRGTDCSKKKKKKKQQSCLNDVKIKKKKRWQRSIDDRSKPKKNDRLFVVRDKNANKKGG